VTQILLRERLEGNHKASHGGQGSRREELIKKTLFAVDGFEPKPENPEPRDNQKINWISNRSHVELLSRAWRCLLIPPTQNAKIFRAIGSDRDASHDLLRGIRRLAVARSLRAEIYYPHISAPIRPIAMALPPSDLELDGGPIARLARAIEAAAADPFTRLEIGAVVEVLDEAAGIGRECRFPFDTALDQSKEHGKPSLSQ
jgi:hypothetical protein